MQVTHTKTPVLQYSEYYPFGLQTSQSWTRENTENNFLYNSGTELNPASGLYDLFFRNYDPTLGRMNQIDPMAGKYGGLSPYNYSFNDPVFWNDPFGADPDEDNEKKNEKKTEPEDAHAGADDMFGDAWEKHLDLIDGMFDALNGVWNADYNYHTYGSYSGVGGATAAGGFGAGFSGSWSSSLYQSGEHWEFKANPTTLDPSAGAWVLVPEYARKWLFQEEKSEQGNIHLT